jgi:hypothetical protein
MIQIPDGTAQKLVELVVLTDQLKTAEKLQQERYSTDRAKRIYELKLKEEELTIFLYPWASDTQHELYKNYPTDRMKKISRDVENKIMAEING